MEATSVGNEAQAILTTEEEIHCHKARIFNLLTKAPVIRSWKNSTCDGAVYVGQSLLPVSYADRYFQMSREDISYVTFSIVTASKETGVEADGQEINRSQCQISPAQREASEFLIVTFSDDHDLVALLPQRLYWPVEGEESSGKEEVGLDAISAPTLFEYSFSINFLLANIEEIRRIAINPMHPTTTPFRIGLDGRIPRAGTPEAIMPQASGPQVTDSDQSVHNLEEQEERALRAFSKEFLQRSHSMRIDFLEYQPLMRDFKIVISNSETFPNGLEAVISHSAGRLIVPDINDNSYHLRYADYHFSHSVVARSRNAFFVPRRLIRDAWFVAPIPKETIPRDLSDYGQKVDNKEFLVEMDEARWVKDIWNIICNYPPEGHPTPAEQKQEIWKKAVPWPEMEAQLALEKLSTPQKAQKDKDQPVSGNDSGTGEVEAVEPSDVSLLADHYLGKVSLKDDEEAGEAAT